MNNKNIVFNSNIKFKYYFKLNNEVKKVVIKYYDLLNLLELKNKKDNKKDFKRYNYLIGLKINNKLK